MFGSQYGKTGIKLTSANGTVFQTNFLYALGLKIIGIPHVGLRTRANKLFRFIGGRKN